MSAPLPGPLGWPPDVASAIASVAAGFMAWRGRRFFGAFSAPRRRWIVGVLAAVAALLSIGYVYQYLRGGPRIIDATSYWLEAKALARGFTTWPIDEPTAAVRGRFLLTSGATDAPRIGVIFPPGYPLVLAFGFLLRAPLLVGPAIAALLVWATHSLARRVSGRDDVALLAAFLSVLSAALRYHTADTMSHGWAALLLTTALALAYRSAASTERRDELVSAALAGIAFGWLFATRPVSAMALMPALALACLEIRPLTRVVLALGAAGPALLFVAQQRAVTGALFTSSQGAYYALADGPPGCFRYGFGKGIGCLHEHGAYVASVLPNGLTLGSAVVTTLRRLRLHLIDVANAEPLVLLAAVPFLRARGADRTDAHRADRRRAIALAVGVVSLVLGYAPFYFDGSYPGGGARMLADVLPLEHVLIALGVGVVTDRTLRIDFPRAAALVCAASALGFGVHAAYEHQALQSREGGRPFYEPAIVASANVTHGLLFTNSDHAFNLAYDPAARDATRGLVVAREHGDDRDRLLWERLGRPEAHRYIFDGRDGAAPAVVPWIAGPEPHPYRFEAEAEWPPIAQSGGYLEPIFAQGTCAWGGQLLAVHPSPTESFHATISFPVPHPGRFRVGVHVASRGDTVARFVMRPSGDGAALATWSFAPPKRDLNCATLAEEELNLSVRAFLDIAARGPGELFIDAIALESTKPAEAPR